jgi:hypothetical protein
VGGAAELKGKEDLMLKPEKAGWQKFFFEQLF